MARRFALRDHAATLLAALLLLATVVYLAKRSVFEQLPDIDFRFIWTAGKLWALGIDPYGRRYTALGHTLFPAGNDIAYWLYPPQWWVIARPLAALPVGRALAVWRGVNAALLLVAAAALALAVRRARPATPPWAAAVFIAVVAFMEGTAQTLLLGQTSILVFAGFCLVGIALLTAQRWPMVMGLLLLLLKPQFAVPIIVCLAIFRQWRIPVLIALGATGLASLPQVLQYGLLPTITGLLGNMAQHGLLPSNQPKTLIGCSHLVWQVTGRNIGNGWDIALDLLTSGALAALVYRRQARDDCDGAALAFGLIAAAMFFLPLHAYDAVALAPLAMLGIVVGGVPRYLAWAAVGIALRPGIISAQFGDRDTGDLLALSMAGLLALIGAIVAVTENRAAR